MISEPQRTSRMIVLSGLALALAAGAGLARTDLFVGPGFGKALEKPRAGLSFDSAATRARAEATAAGDEGYWLTRAEVESPGPFAKPVAIGDRITIAGRDGGERQLEVVDLKAIGGNLVRTGTDHVRLLLVTCRVVGPAGGQPAERAEAPVRFIVEAGPQPMPATPAPAKAL